MRTRLLPYLNGWFVLGLLLAGGRAAAQSVPVKIQAVIFKKILLFDRTIAQGSSPHVLILYGTEQQSAEDLKGAFAAVGLQSDVAKSGDLKQLANSQAVYFFPSAATKDARQAAVRAKALSFSGEGKLAESGDVAVALRIKDDKPVILVNLSAVKAAEHDLSSDLLRLATVIQ